MLNEFPIKLDQIVFEERVKINCFYCAKYKHKWACPPNIPDIDYKKVFSEYDHFMIVGGTFTADQRELSTNVLHKHLLKLERVLWERECPLAISFIGGSCKLCKQCSPDKCSNPASARIPLEATGVNVVKTLSNIGIYLNFNEGTISRYGLLFQERLQKACIGMTLELFTDEYNKVCSMSLQDIKEGKLEWDFLK